MTETPIDPTALEDKAPSAGRQAYREEVLALVRLCELAKAPHKLAAFIEQSVSPEAARDHLLSYLAERQPQTIRNTHAPQQGEATSPLIDIAKIRAQSHGRSV